MYKNLTHIINRKEGRYKERLGIINKYLLEELNLSKGEESNVKWWRYDCKFV